MESVKEKNVKEICLKTVMNVVMLVLTVIDSGDHYRMVMMVI